MSKPRLIIFEGHDQTGKHTLLNYIKEKNPSFYLYKQKTSEEQGVDYRDKEKYEAWLYSYIKNQIEELKEISKNNDTIIMTRLIISDNVYSDCFGRNHIVEPNFKEDIYSFFDVKTITILWKNYEQYLQRVRKTGGYIQYDCTEFYRIKELYEKYSSKEDTIYITNNLSTEEIYNILFNG